MEDVNNLKILSLGIFGAILFGLSLFFLKKEFQKYTRWIFFFVLLFFFGVVLFVATAQDPIFAPADWSRGWVLPRDALGAITAGFLVDAQAFLGLFFATALTALLGGFLSIRADTPSWARVIPSFLVSLGGFSISVTALTPWMVFIGFFISVFGGAVVLGAKWKTDADSMLGVRFAWERSSGLFCSIFGACVLAATQPPLLLNHQVAGVEPLGGALLLLGLFSQFQSFPFSARRLAQRQVPLVASVLVAQVLPGWAVLFFLARFEPSLTGSTIVLVYGWISLFSAVLSTGEGLFQSESPRGITIWVSAGFAFASALFAFSGAQAGFVWGLGVGLGGISLSLFAENGRGQKTEKKTVNKQNNGLLVLISSFLSCAAGTGFLGFVSSIGGHQWFTQGLESAPMAASFSVALFCLAFLGWKNFFQLNRIQSGPTVPLVTAVLSLFVVSLSLSVFWDGTLFGGVVLEGADSIFPSILRKIFIQLRPIAQKSDMAIVASGGYFGIALFAFFTAYWGFGRKRDVLSDVAKKFVRMFGVVSDGYGIDRLFAGALRFLIFISERLYRRIDQVFWGRLLPAGFSRIIEKGSQVITVIDLRFFVRLSAALRGAVELPAKALQLIQNGNVQWYLFFAVASGIAVLLNFLKG
ncbi:hypothetical protein WDW86_20035 [Bdellovibrionota bacterium FG-2]